MTLFPLSGIVLLRDLGPLPEDKLGHTLWRKGLPLVYTNRSYGKVASFAALPA